MNQSLPVDTERPILDKYNLADSILSSDGHYENSNNNLPKI
jgi:hypothetical protein